jgi:hypothetical protein
MRSTLLFFSLISCIQLFAQSNLELGNNRVGENLGRGPSLAKVEEKAEEALKDGDQYLALDYYSRVIAVDSNKISALRGYAQAAFEYASLSQAEWATRRILSLIPKDEEANLFLAEILYREGNYEEAQLKFTVLLSGGSGNQSEMAEKGVEKTSWAISKRDNSDFSQKAILLDTSINTGYSEYMNWPNNDGSFYFSAYKFPFKGDKGDRKRNRYLNKVLEAKPAGGDTFSTALADFNEDKRHTLHPTFNGAGDVMYYAQGDFVNSADIHCELYMRKKEGERWGKPQKLPAAVNIPGFTVTEPNVGKVPGETGETLFFVSDRPGGKGDRDIWYCAILPDGSLSEPQNLEATNTEKDDVTPFYHSFTGTLYFSTAGQQSMGGFDVYKVVGGGIFWSAIEHLEPPVNSYANDVFFTLTKEASVSYLSSNRFGSANISEEACCYDIFQVPLVKSKMVAVTFNAITQDSLPRTNIRLYELVDGKRVLVDSANNIPLAFYPFSVDPGKSYVLIADKTGFKPDTVPFVTPRLAWPGVMSQNLFLTPLKVDLIARVFDKISKEPIIGATARFIDLGPVPDNFPTIAGIGSGKVDKNPGGNEFDYPLEFDHNYKVYISKDGFTTDSAFVTTKGLKENTTIRKDLYLQRGINLEALVYDNTSSNLVPIFGVKFELYEVPKTGNPILVTEDIRTLDNQFNSVLDYNRRYRIVASKEKFSSDTVDFNVPQLTNKPFETIRQELNIHSLDLEKYLPIRLYYDNDEPNKRTMATTTDKLYSQTYFGYYPQKDTFIAVYTDNLTGIVKEKAIKDLEIFFEDSLKGEWNRLRFFTEVLFEKLKNGDHVDIELKGFASPRAPSGYNKNLTSRRIFCVMNHFSDFDGALLKKYIDTKQLVVREVPNGEEKSRPNVNDNYFDPRNSVFSPEASKERRVEIIGIEFIR